MMKIAIIGNSGSILKKQYGSLIDSHETIVRFNEAPTFGFQKHVGSRTDLRFIAYHGADYSLKGEDILLYSYSKKAQQEAFEKLHPNNSVAFLSKEFIRRCDNMIGKPYWKWRLLPGQTIIHKIMSTTGLKSIIYFLERQQPISLFGFDTERISKHFHYYEKNRPGYSPFNSHDFDKEMQIIKGFEREGKLKIFS